MGTRTRADIQLGPPFGNATMTNRLDLATESLREVNSTLHNPSDRKEFEILHPKGVHSLAAGLNATINVTVDGHVGYYCAGMNQLANIRIDGNAGPGIAENMISGEVVVTGNASQYAGASGHGGLLVIRGNASSRCGISMKGIDIVVGGSVGHFSAFMAQKGRLVICGDASNDLGDSIYEAQLFVRGKVARLGSDCIEKDMRPEHLEQLQMLLDKAKMKYSAKEFRRYGSARRLYNFNIDNADAITG